MTIDTSHQREYLRVGWILAIILVAVGANAAAPAKTKGLATDALFSQPAPVHVQITVPEAGMQTLRKSHWDPGEPGEREVAQVTVREGGTVYTNVALHLKGAAGSFRNIDDKPALTLNFDRFAKRQHFHGLTKLSLNNSVQDPASISEQLCRELFNQAGVPVPRAMPAFVELNGRDLGLYVLTEGWDRDFLKRHFKNPRGNLYDGGFLRDVGDQLTVNSGPNSTNQTDRIALVDAAKEPDLTKRLERLEKTLDVDRFISLLALDVILWNWDGYAMNRNNWRLFHDRETGRMVLMPHGLDQMLWKPDGSILPPMQGLVANAVLQLPTLRQRYFARLRELTQSRFQPEILTNRAHAIAATFQPTLREKHPEVAQEQAKALNEFCDAMVRRRQSLDRQLAHPVEPVAFDAQGFTKLVGWESKSDFGFPAFSSAVETDGRRALHIATTQGSSVGSWQTRVWLEKGLYRLQGSFKTQGITPDPGDSRGGAGVRGGRSKPDGYLVGDSDWRPLDYEFTVEDALVEFPIVCEFRGTQGQVWFDLDSLRLKKAAPPSHP